MNGSLDRRRRATFFAAAGILDAFIAGMASTSPAQGLSALVVFIIALGAGIAFARAGWIAAG